MSNPLLLLQSLSSETLLLLQSLSLTSPLNLFLLLSLIYLLSLLYPSYPLLPGSITHIPIKPTEYNWRPNQHNEVLLWKQFKEIDLKEFNGENEKELDGGRILFAIRRKVYDVTAGRSFYGPGSFSPLPLSLFFLSNPPH